MRLDLTATIICAFGPLPSSLLWHWILRTLRSGRPTASLFAMWGFTAAVELLIAAFQREAIPAAVSAANVVLAVVCWWLSRRRRDRAPRSYGAKSRARIAALVRMVRESLKPRPVFRPQPGSAA